jgi:hypothetical protein
MPPACCLAVYDDECTHVLQHISFVDRPVGAENALKAAWDWEQVCTMQCDDVLLVFQGVLLLFT